MDEEIVIWRQNGATIYIGHDVIKPKVQYHRVRKIILRKNILIFFISELVNFLLYANTQAIRQILGKASSNNNALSIDGIFHYFFSHFGTLCALAIFVYLLVEHQIYKHPILSGQKTQASNFAMVDFCSKLLQPPNSCTKFVQLDQNLY